MVSNKLLDLIHRDLTQWLLPESLTGSLKYNISETMRIVCSAWQHALALQMPNVCIFHIFQIKTPGRVHGKDYSNDEPKERTSTQSLN